MEKSRNGLQILIYLACHPKFGTHTFYLKHGAKGGGKKRFDYGGMYDGCKFWSSDLTQGEVEALRKISWGNTKASVDKFMLRESVARGATFKHGRDYNHHNHLVSFATTLPASPCQSANVAGICCGLFSPTCFAALLRNASTC